MTIGTFMPMRTQYASKTSRHTVAAFALLVASATGAHADVTSIGDWSCKEWQARRTAGTRVDPPQMWLSGFMTGLATAGGADVLSIVDGAQLFEAMDKFCAAHPDATLASGGLIVFDELRHRLPPPGAPGETL